MENEKMKTVTVIVQEVELVDEERGGESFSGTKCGTACSGILR